MVARKILENWLYWLVIDSLSAVLVLAARALSLRRPVRAVSRARRDRARALASRLARASRSAGMTRAATSAGVRAALARVLARRRAVAARRSRSRSPAASTRAACLTVGGRQRARAAAARARARWRCSTLRPKRARCTRPRRPASRRPSSRSMPSADCCSRTTGRRCWTPDVACTARAGVSNDRAAAARAASAARRSCPRIRGRAHRATLRRGAGREPRATPTLGERLGDELTRLARRYDARYAPTRSATTISWRRTCSIDGPLALVDFEYAVRGAPILDLASLAGMNDYTESQRGELLPRTMASRAGATLRRVSTSWCAWSDCWRCFGRCSARGARAMHWTTPARRPHVAATLRQAHRIEYGERCVLGSRSHGVSDGRLAAPGGSRRHGVQPHAGEGRKMVPQHAGKAAASPAEAAQGAEIVFSCVGDDPDLREIALGTRRRHRARCARRDLRRSHDRLGRNRARDRSGGRKRGVHCLDAPVSGGQAGAENGKLTVMVGGEPEPLRRRSP